MNIHEPLEPEIAPANGTVAPKQPRAAEWVPVADPPPDACPACSSRGVRVLFRATDTLYGTTDETFAVVECESCRLIRLMPRPSPEELIRYYPEQYWHVSATDTAGKLEEQYRRFALWDHVRFVEKALERSGAEGPVLDVGCGGGLFLRRLRERGRQVLGLDFSLAAAGVAWEGNQVPTVCATLSSAPFAPGSCAGVTMFHVLEHLYDPASYLRAARELLSDDGRLIVQTPNAACWQFLLLGERWRGVEAPRHLINYRASDLELLLDRCGFEVVRTKHFIYRDNPPCLATSLAPSLDPTVRHVRHVEETPRQKLFKDLAYLALVAVSTPLTMLEAACRAGCTVMMEARKRP